MEAAWIVLGHTTVSVISGLQAKTVRLTLMNVGIPTIARIKVFVLTSMNPAPPVQNAKDFNVSVVMASQVFQISIAIKSSSSFFKLADNSQGKLTQGGKESFRGTHDGPKFVA